MFKENTDQFLCLKNFRTESKEDTDQFLFLKNFRSAFNEDIDQLWWSLTNFEIKEKN